MERLPNIQRVAGQYPTSYIPRPPTPRQKTAAVFKTYCTIIVGVILCCLIGGCVIVLCLQYFKPSSTSSPPLTDMPRPVAPAPQSIPTAPRLEESTTTRYHPLHSWTNPIVCAASLAGASTLAYTQYQQYLQDKEIKHLTVAQVHSWLHKAMTAQKVDHVRKILDTTLCLVDPKPFESQIYVFDVDKMRMRNHPRLIDIGTLEKKHDLLDAARLWAIYHLRTSQNPTHKSQEIILLLAKDGRVNIGKHSWRRTLYEDFRDGE